MNDIDYLFFELIRLAIGTQNSLSRVPSVDEWRSLYEMAKKQSLVGICFAGVQRMCDMENEYYAGLTEMQYLTWMGMATKIQMRNGKVNKQCVELCQMLEREGFRSCILKGQGTAALYRVRSSGSSGSSGSNGSNGSNGSSGSSGSNGSSASNGFNQATAIELLNSPMGVEPEERDLSLLRQSGDIDVWVMPKEVRTIKESRKRIADFVHGTFPDEKGAFIHIGFPIFKETEVEVHFVPAMDGNPWVEQRWTDLFEKYQDECFGNVNNLGFAIPEPQLNVLYNLRHISGHFFSSGIGLRHVIDLFFLLLNFARLEVLAEASVCSSRASRDTRLEVRDMIKKLGMEKFFVGIVWVMEKVLGNNSNLLTLISQLGIKPDERLGRFILQEIMRGGNFGHHDERLKGVNEMGFWKRWKHIFCVSIVRARYFPSNIFWSYVFRLRVGIWRKTGLEV